MATPNMNLTLPVPGTGGTPGPTWASEINTALETVDAHAHTSGDGVAIASAAIDIDADLVFNDFSLTSLLAAKFTTQASNPTGEPLIFVKNGELTYIDSSGNVVPITTAGAVAGSVGSISGLASPASASFGSDTFTWLYDSAKAARMANADIILYPYDGIGTAYVNTVTIKAPTALAAAYSLTLPLAVPANSNIVCMDGSGVLSVGAATGSAANPSISFAADLDTGFYNSGTNTLAVTCAGARVGYFNADGYHTATGTAALPSYTFDGDTNTGLYRTAADSIGLSTGGTLRVTLNTASLTSTLPFIGTTITGSTSVDAPTVTASTAFRAAVGSAAVPSYSFTGDTNTGIYNTAGADQINFSSGGVQVAELNADGLAVGSLASTDHIKWEVVTGSLVASDTDTITVGTTILGACGYSTFNGTAVWGVMGTDQGASTTNSIVFGGSATGDTNTFLITNRDTTSTNSYRIVVYYQ